MDTIPTYPSPPVIGAARQLLSFPGPFLMDGYRRFGSVFRFHLFHMPMVALLGPEANRTVLVDRRDHFSHAEGYAIVRKVLGDGLIFQDGDVHRRNRTLMTPAFHQRGVQQYFDLMKDCTVEHLQRWPSGGRAPMFERFRHLTFEIMARLILAVDDSSELQRLGRLNHQMADGVAAFLRVGWRWTMYGKGLRARDSLRSYLRGVIARRRLTPGTDALGLLMAARDENGDALSEDELLEQAVILMFAGHETTTSMLTSLLLVLRDRPDLHERLRREQRRVVGDDELTLAHVRELNDLDLVLKEVERFYPPVNLCQRGVVKDVEVGGHLLRAGTIASYCPWVTHRLPNVFRDPDHFDPDRFAAPREEHKATPYSLIGFGGGPRLCIGQAFAQLEMKIVATLLLQSYEWQVDSGDPRLRHVPTLHPRTGLPGTVWSRRADGG